MTIQPSKASQLYNAYAAPAKNGEGKAAKAAVSADRHDRLELSKDAAGIMPQQSLAAAVSREVETGTSPERLAALRDSIASGTYTVSAADISAAIVDTAFRV
ncbi:MAG: flagellar biosynthesis anti-sigma factor FlgM [Acetanaerobacterium sp.]